MKLTKEMKKMSNRAAKAALKMHQNKYGVEFSTKIRQGIQTHPGHLLVRRRRLILAYEALVRNIDKLNWVVDMDFAEDIDNGNLEFKKDRYSDFYKLIKNLKEHISGLNNMNNSGRMTKIIDKSFGADNHYRQLNKLDHKDLQGSLHNRERDAWEKFDEELINR
jgi:hypothetical protein